MVSAKPQIVARLALGLIALSLSLSLAACSPRPSARQTGADDAGAQEQAYIVPPQVDAVRAGPDGVTLVGAASAAGRVRLATPSGEAIFAPVDARGRWAITLPPAAEARIFGLSVTLGERKAQAEGYVLVTPSGQAALLRAGAGALRIDPAPRPSLRAIDFDRGGGIEASVQAPPGALVTLKMDGREAAEGRADAAGRYEVSLSSITPIRAGTHQVQVQGDGFSDETTVEISPAAPLAPGPLRSQLTPAGLRVDWMTPGGGVQSTLLVN